jgi:hypothetical protein
MLVATKYRQHAADCLRLAQLTSAPQDKTVLAQMAAMWLRLAEFTESASIIVAAGDEEVRR